jgi:hypothetical protein
MSDGASLNIPADAALGAILGDEDPEQLSDEEFEASVREADTDRLIYLSIKWQEEREAPDYYEKILERTKESGMSESYGLTGDVLARGILEMYEKYPETQELPEEHLYTGDYKVHLNTTIVDVFKQVYDEDSPYRKYAFSGCSGFQWGWAVNAARHILKLGSLPNPALFTVSIPNE